MVMIKKKSLGQIMLSFVLTATMVLLLSINAFAAEPYVHNPMENPSAAKDIVVDPSAVYGYAPSPDSPRLKDYVEYDWSDTSVVAEMRQKREEYHESMQELYSMIATMKNDGASVEEIARAVSTRRNEIRLESYKDDPEGLEKVKKSNLENYGDENGGTPEFFYDKYGSWEIVIEKALSTNAGADACLGLYDKYYDTYFITTAGSTPDAAGSESAAKTTTSNEYTVVSGDCLSKIARMLLGDETKWTVIYDMNKDSIKDPGLIYPGQVLKVNLDG